MSNEVYPFSDPDNPAIPKIPVWLPYPLAEDCAARAARPPQDFERANMLVLNPTPCDVDDLTEEQKNRLVAAVLEQLTPVPNVCRCAEFAYACKPDSLCNPDTSERYPYIDKENGEWHFISILSPIKYCPWCGKELPR
jgi:hypothetical protein